MPPARILVKRILFNAMAGHIVRDMLAFLRRTDRYQLGSGDGLQFAPPHPLWLHRPGLWDGIQYFTYVLRPAYTLALVRRDGREIRMDRVATEWSPAEQTTTFGGEGIRLVERTALLPGGRIRSALTIASSREAPRDIGLIAWTALEGVDIDRDGVRATDRGIAFRSIAPARQQADGTAAFDARIEFEGDAVSCCAVESQQPRDHPNAPDWSASPLAALWTVSGFRDAHIPPHAPDGRTLVVLAVARQLRLEPGRPLEARLHMDIAPVEQTLRLQAGTLVHETALPDRRRSVVAWTDFFDGSPALESSDPFIDRYFAWRWYGLRLNFLDPAGNYAHPTCAEGSDVFHAAISYSAWTHVRELRWLNDATRARGVIRTFLDHQHEDGALPGIIGLRATHPAASYFADWGGSVMALDEIHPDAGFLRACFQPLARYAAFMQRTRDPDRTGLYRVLDPYETGQETMSRYRAVDDTADTQHFDYRLQLLGVDITVYMYRLHRALARMAATLGLAVECHDHDALADRIGDAVRTRMWDSSTEMFADVDPRSARRTGIQAAVCFYPYLTDIAGEEHVAGLERNLFDPSKFWTPFPVPSTSAADPTFNADGFWKGVRQNCPWNGRVWPMTNSHIADALGHVATTHAQHLRERAGEFIMRYLRMLFFDGDPARPNSFEHYSPVTGEPSVFRGLDDYQHSWINDLIIRWVIGFRPDGSGFIIDPLPCGIENAQLDRIPFRGTNVSVRIDGETITATAHGERRVARGEPLVVTGR